MSTDILSFKTTLDGVHDSLAVFGESQTRIFFKGEVEIVRKLQNYEVQIIGYKRTSETFRTIPTDGAFARQREKTTLVFNGRLKEI
jgi:hypothetical protein